MVVATCSMVRLASDACPVDVGGGVVARTAARTGASFW